MPDFVVRTIENAATLPFAEVLDIYESAGWTAYTGELGQIQAALAGSSFVAGAYVGDRLVGLVRAISDDASISYVQDVLVHTGAQRAGVGTALMQAVAQRYPHVRQHVLITDDEPGQRAFYESLGYAEIRDYADGSLRAFVRFP
jgi:GNAT superfamily N-acetyltransferase